jgi:hypothetical protein
MRSRIRLGLTVAVLSGTLLGCVPATRTPQPGQVPLGETTRVLALAPDVTATIVEPVSLDRRRPVELILYTLPNGNTTAQTIGQRMTAGLDWHFDIQHIGAQTRALRARGLGLEQAVVIYLEAEGRSWPAWRAKMGYPSANARLAEIVRELRGHSADVPRLSVTLTGHSGGGSFMFGFIEGEDAIPDWLGRISMLDAAYNFDGAVHGAKLLGGSGAIRRTGSSRWPTTIARSCWMAGRSCRIRVVRGARRSG